MWIELHWTSCHQQGNLTPKISLWRVPECAVCSAYCPLPCALCAHVRYVQYLGFIVQAFSMFMFTMKSLLCGKVIKSYFCIFCCTAQCRQWSQWVEKSSSVTSDTSHAQLLTTKEKWILNLKSWKREIFQKSETCWLEIHFWCTPGLARSGHQLEFPRQATTFSAFPPIFCSIVFLYTVLSCIAKYCILSIVHT